MYRNIMVPVDGSAFSREAVLQGLRIASKCGATLRLVRVETATVPLAVPQTVAIVNQDHLSERNAVLADLYSIAVECRAHSTVTVTASLEKGPVADALIGYAKRHSVDLIVIRSHARKGLARLWFGSVADDLIRKSGIPVMVVRQPSLATALESGFQLKRILVPLDGSSLAEESLRAAATTARCDGASLTLLRVVAPYTHNNHDDDLESDIGPASAMEVDEARHYLASLFTSSTDRFAGVSRRVIISDDVAGTILRVAESEETDLIAIATRGRGSIVRAAAGSVADQVMRGSAVSTLIVHPLPESAERSGYRLAARELAATGT